MDSTFDYVHWEKSSLPIIADLWENTPRCEELIDIPAATNIEEAIELQLNEKESNKSFIKVEWKPSPMEH